MNLVLKRVEMGSDYTIGELFAGNEERFSYVCEDVVREPGVKVKGKTAIPPGRYEIKITFSPRFKVRMPLLMDVPMFEGIRIHPGNTADDTEGCLLPGYTRMEKGVGDSRNAYRALFNKLQAEETRGHQNWIDIQ